MKKFMAILAFLLLTAAQAFAVVPAPTGLTLTPWASDGTVTLSWDNNPSATNWNIYFGGAQRFSVDRYSIQLPTTYTARYTLTGISSASLPVVVTMTAQVGTAVSAASSPVTITTVSSVPFQYIYPAPGAVFNMSSGGGSSTVAQGAAGSSPWLVSGNMGLLSNTGLGIYGADLNTDAFSAPIYSYHYDPTDLTYGRIPTSKGLLGTAAALFAYKDADTRGEVVHLGQQTKANSLAVTLASDQDYATETTLASLANTFNNAFDGGVGGAPSMYGNGYKFIATQAVLNAVLGTGGVTQPLQAVGATNSFSSVPSGPYGLLTASQLYLKTGSSTGAAVSFGQQTKANSVPITLASDQGNLSINTAQINGVTPLMNNGASGAGAQRVVIASDNTPFQVGISHTVSTNIAQIIGGPISTNNGTAGAGTQRFVIASDSAYIGVTTVGNVASGASDSGNPLKIGGLARVALPVAVTDTQRVNAAFDTSGRFITIRNGQRGSKANKTTTFSTTAENTIVSANSQFLDLETFMASNGSTQTVRVDVRDATAGTVRFSMWLAPGATVSMPIGSIITQTTAGNGWTAQLDNGTATNDVRIFTVATDGR